jgi:hypothetical protein
MSPLYVCVSGCFFHSQDHADTVTGAVDDDEPLILNHVPMVDSPQPQSSAHELPKGPCATHEAHMWHVYNARTLTKCDLEAGFTFVENTN